MTDTVLTSNHPRDKFTHLESLIQQLDDRDLDEAIRLVEALLDRGHRPGDDGPVRSLVPVPRRPPSPTND